MTDTSDLQRAVQDRRNGTRTGRGGGQGRAVVPANGVGNAAGDSGGGGLAAIGPDDQVRLMRETITRQTTAFRTVLPASVDPDRFARLTINAMRSVKGLMDVFRTELGQVSVLFSCMQLATVGLEPNTPTQDAWILPRSVRRQNASGQWYDSHEAQQVIGYRGYVRLIRRGEGVLSPIARTVREGDLFDYEYGLDDRLVHKPRQNKFGEPGMRGEITHAYAVVRWTNGGRDFMVLDREAIDKRRAMSDAWKADLKKEPEKRTSPWWVWPEPMAAKSAMRAIVPFVPLETVVAAVIANDERALRFDPVMGALVDDEPPADDGDGDDLDPIVEATAREAITAGGTPPPATGVQEAASGAVGVDATDTTADPGDAGTAPTVPAGDDAVTRRAQQIVDAAMGVTNITGDGPITIASDGAGKQRARATSDANKWLAAHPADHEYSTRKYRNVGELAADPEACAAYIADLTLRPKWDASREAF